MSMHPFFDPRRLLPSAPPPPPNRMALILEGLRKIQEFMFSLNGIGLLIAGFVIVVFLVWFCIRLANWLMGKLDGVFQ